VVKEIFMADYRCPLHDLVFQANTDVTRPGSKPEHNGCHPDCPKYGETKGAAVAGGSRKIG